ncbi:MAG: nicotinate-nucleotide--dimethylbenzimidazole phosphoribosyltransferase [Sandaracinaceae bacterium]|nr:nicotinate-nucleotide--dimethylbenzimidazole phosphoribosyltransferase [Sandaracinaceae bacterium]
MQAAAPFSEADTRGLYRAIYERRDIRNYRPEPVPDDVLSRILEAAHHAPSVGLMQPWSFLILRDRAVRARVHAHFADVNARAAEVWEGDRRDTYSALKLQGILDAPLNVLVTCDPRRAGEHVLGRFTMPETAEYSTCLAVQNLWLAARAEGVGVGWMSLAEPEALRTILGVPEHVVPVAYLTMGYPVAFPPRPMLENVGWRAREALQPLVHEDTWGRPHHALPFADGSGTATDGPQPTPSAQVDDGVAGARQAEHARTRLDELTKPPGSLGRLEDLIVSLARLQERPQPRCDRAALLLFAGDHGVSAQKVSAYRPDVTAKMVYQYLAGGAVVNALCREQQLPFTVVDVGVDHDFEGAPGLTHAKVRRGTRDFTKTAAMTAAELDAALRAGRDAVRALGPLDALALGEMGIANTTSASAVVAALLRLRADEVVGRGTGVGEVTLGRKRDAVAAGLALHQPTDADAALRTLGGYEIAALVGAMEEARARGIAVVLDGFITGAAALAAVARTPAVADALIAGHVSAERAHVLVLGALGLAPLLSLDMCLGEGSGAVLAIHLLRSAARVSAETRTFEEANMRRSEDPAGLR